MVKGTISLTTTLQPSTLFNKFGLNLPHYGAGRLQKTANQRRERHTVVVPLKERVLIPHGLIHHEITPKPAPDDTVAIEEVPLPAVPGPTAGALNITAKDLLKRKVLNLGWDGRKLQVLFPELMARLAGNERPLSGQRSHAHRVWHPQPGRVALHLLCADAQPLPGCDVGPGRHDHANHGPGGRHLDRHLW